MTADVGKLTPQSALPAPSDTLLAELEGPYNGSSPPIQSARSPLSSCIH